jgi:hypothetical protein
VHLKPLATSRRSKKKPYLPACHSSSAINAPLDLFSSATPSCLPLHLMLLLLLGLLLVMAWICLGSRGALMALLLWQAGKHVFSLLRLLAASGSRHT